MGQKVNPVGMRVGINRNWNSRWYANDKEFATFLHEDIKIRKYLTKELKDALLSHVDIERKRINNDYKVDIQVFVARPAVALGEAGANIKVLSKAISKIIGKDKQLHLDIVKVENPDLDACLVAQWIASELENRASFRTVQKKAIQKVRKAGAKGCRTIVSGRLGGADIARGEGYKEGIIPLQTLRSDIDYAECDAATTYGRLGVKVWICRGESQGMHANLNENKEKRAHAHNDEKGE